MSKRTIGERILFAEAKARVDEINRLIDEYNELAETLRGMGYGEFPQPPIEETRPYLPNLRLSSTCMDYPDSSFLDEVWMDGPLGKSRLRPISTRSAITAAERTKIGTESGWRCFYCGGQGDTEQGPDGRSWHVDHIYPIIQGGDNKPDNKALSCATCNLQKSAKTALEHFRRLVSIVEGRSLIQ